MAKVPRYLSQKIGDLNRAVITASKCGSLLLTETEKLLRKKVETHRPRVPPSRLLQSATEVDSPDSSFVDDDETQDVVFTSTLDVVNPKPNSKLKTQSGKSMAINEIMYEYKKRCHDDGDLDSYSDFEEPLTKKVQRLQSSDANRENQKLRQKLSVKEEEIIGLKLEVSRLAKLNDELQNNVINHFKELTENQEKSNDQGLPPVGAVRDGKAHVGLDVWISSGQMDAIQSTAIRPSLYVRGLANAIWGATTLKDRSVFGKGCPLKPDRAARPPLTPRKVNAITESLKQWLLEKGTSDFRMGEQLRDVPKYISQRIADLNRQQPSPEEKLALSIKNKTKRQAEKVTLQSRKMYTAAPNPDSDEFTLNSF